MNKQKVISLFLALAMLLSTGTAMAADRSRASPVAAFTDCDPNAWYVPAIAYAVEHEIMEGVGDGQMAPERTITRAEFVTMICRLLDAKATADISRYEDVPDNAWYRDFMAMGLKLGIVQGVSPTRLDPMGSLTREQAVVILARVLALSGGDVGMLDKYTDKSEISDWAVDAVRAMTATGRLKGYPDGTLRPRQNITRAEAAQLLMNCLPISDKKPNVSVDNRPKVYFVPQINGSTASYGKPIGKDEIIQPMEPPVWEGHVFGGWYTEPECEIRISFTQPVTKGMRLYGKWYTDAEWAAIEQLNETAAKGTARVRCETELLATIGTDKLPCHIHSDETNSSSLRVELIREDTGAVVAVIDRLAPGETATEMSVTAMPGYGNYNATLVFRDAEGVRQAELQATLYVAYLWNRGE